EHGELASTALEAAHQQLLRCGSDQDPVPLAHGRAEQTVTDGSPHQGDLHGAMLAVRRASPRSCLLRLILVALVLATLPACGTVYLMQAARGQWQVMRERRPIQEVMADSRTPDELRARLAEVVGAREFASRELKLPDN